MERLGKHESEEKNHYFVTHTESGQVLDLDDPRYEMTEGLLRLGIYRHYKSTPENLKYYQAEAVVLDVASDEHLVVYRPLDSHEDVTLYARPLEMFKGHVEVGKGKIPRFRYVGSSL